MFIYHDTRNLKNHSFNFQVEVRDLMHNDYDLSSAFDKVKDVKKTPFHIFIRQGDLSGGWNGGKGKSESQEKQRNLQPRL